MLEAGPSQTTIAEQTAADVYPTIGLLIGGTWVTDREPCHQVRNPSTEAVLGPVPRASAADLALALEAADKGFRTWRLRPASERARLLRRVAALMHERIDRIAKVITLEQGKPLSEARREVERSASFLEWDAEQVLRTYGRLIPADPPVRQLVLREPIGPVAAFTPWNVPLSSPSRKLSASIAAGCSVIIKPAEETPGTAVLFAQCFLDAGLPPGVLNVVFGDPAEVSTTLIASPVIRMITLTGSVHVGKVLTRLAGAEMKPALMELGGHAAVVVGGGVDPRAVAEMAAVAKFRAAGQLCVSPSRFIVHQDVYEDFVQAFGAAAGRIQVGDGFSDGVQMGPVANARRLQAVTGLVDDAVAKGARVAAGGRRIGNQGCFYAPTVLADVPGTARAMSEEPFSPLALCVPTASLEEGIALANSLPVGLAGYGFTNTLEEADLFMRDMQCGVLSINNFGSPGADAPFGGFKDSGIGKEGGEESLDSYMVSKTVLLASNRL